MDKHIKVAFENTYRENVDALFRFVLFRVSDKDEAIDIVEDTFVRLWQTIQEEHVREPRALLFKIARNLIIDWYRKKKSVPMQNFTDGRDEEGEKSMDMFDGGLVGAEIMLEARLVVEKMGELDPIYREAVYLRFAEEMTPKEIALVLGETPNVISVRINRGVSLLKSKLDI